MSKGLTNLGNTCYMNSSLQCLMHLPYLLPHNKSLIKDCRRRLKGNDFTLMREFFKIQKEMWTGESSVVNPRLFIKEFMKQCNQKNIFFESFLQNDAQEFITIIIDLLHDSIKRKVQIEISGKPSNTYDLMKVKSIESWRKFFESNYSYIIKNFYSKLHSNLECPRCGYHTDNYEPISTITLTLKDKYKSIYHCLDEFISKEKLDSWKCDKCHREVSPTKKMQFFELSPILIFSIKQFRRGMKINQYIEFPEYLSMDKYSINYKKENTKYRLSGICVHQGNLNGGHYYAMCYNYLNSKWSMYNDEQVSEVTIDKVLKEEPYCLFYIKTD